MPVVVGHVSGVERRSGFGRSYGSFEKGQGYCTFLARDVLAKASRERSSGSVMEVLTCRRPSFSVAGRPRGPRKVSSEDLKDVTILGYS